MNTSKKALVVISEYKQEMLDRLLDSGVKLSEISRIIGVQYDTLREKLRRRKRGDTNWHNRAGVDNRGAHRRAMEAKNEAAESARDDLRIQLFDLTKRQDGLTVADAVKLTGLSEDVCLMELTDFCQQKKRSDLEAICRKEGERYFAIGWQSRCNHAAKAVEVFKVLWSTYRRTA